MKHNIIWFCSFIIALSVKGLLRQSHATHILYRDVKTLLCYNFKKEKHIILRNSCDITESSFHSQSDDESIFYIHQNWTWQIQL